MGNFCIQETDFQGLYVIEPKVFGDNRGYFMETFHEEMFAKAGITEKFVQDNQSFSRKGVLRGLHYQKNHPQGKLVRVVSGQVYDVVVDLRKDSKMVGKWFGVLLSDTNQKQVYVPPGFAHGFVVLSDTCIFTYKCTDYYHADDEAGIIWNDTNLNITWEQVITSGAHKAPCLVDGTPLQISEKDKLWPTLQNANLWEE